MQWDEKCLLELTHHNMFESSEHRLRFRDLISCYYKSPFFSKGLCKCMYIACMDEEHFIVMLDELNELTISGARNLQDMHAQGIVMEIQAEPGDIEIMKLSNAFVTGEAYELPDFTLMDPDKAHIIKRAILASNFIDDLPDPRQFF